MSVLAEAVVLITGANRGIGRAAVERFADAGATVIAVARDTGSNELRAITESLGDRIALERCDIARETDVVALRDRVAARFPSLHALVNNAGVYLNADRTATADTLPLDVLRATLDVNLFGTVAMCTAFSPMMARGGRIINVSSTMGQLDDGLDPSSVAYSVSKTALNAYTSALAAALSDREILVDAMHPGWVKTKMGGSGATIEPHAATETMLFLATRPLDGETGGFWYESRRIPW